MKIRVRRAEIAKNHRYAQRALVTDHFTAGLLNAAEAGFELTIRRAAITIQDVAVVTRFVDDEAIPAVGGTRGLTAIRLGLATGGAAVERDGIAVVAALCALLLPITTSGRAA